MHACSQVCAKEIIFGDKVKPPEDFDPDKKSTLLRSRDLKPHEV